VARIGVGISCEIQCQFARRDLVVGDRPSAPRPIDA
jgi:hypothetical protein